MQKQESSPNRRLYLAMNCHPKHTWQRWVFCHRPRVEAQTGFSYWRRHWHPQHSVHVSNYPLFLVGSNWSRLFWGWSTDQTGSPMHSERPEERGVFAVGRICSRLLSRGQRRARGRPSLGGGRDSKLPGGMSLLWLVSASCRRQSQSVCHHWTGSDIIAVTHIQCGKLKFFTILRGFLRWLINITFQIRNSLYLVTCIFPMWSLTFP